MSAGFLKTSSILKKTPVLSRLYLQFFVFVIVSFVPWVAFAINSDQWQIEHLQVEDGLPDSTLYSITQDQTGFVWFGTTSGLARYDGYTFKTLKHNGENTNSISNNNAGNIFIDSKNNLWIGTFGGGANKLDLDNKELTRYPYSNSQIETMISENVQTFYEDVNGVIWVGTATGLYQVIDDNEIERFDPNIDKDKGEASRIWDIVGKQGNLWIGTSDGLYCFDQNSEKFIHFALPKELVTDISSHQFRTLYVKDNTLWIGSSSGLFSFDLITKIFHSYSPDGRSIKINHIHQTPDDSLLIASMNGLFLFDTESRSFKQDSGGDYWQILSHIDIRNIYIDQSGIMWLATRDSGVYKVNLAGGLFQHHTNFVPENERNEKVKQVWTLGVDDSNTVLLGTSEALFKLKAEEDSQRMVAEGINSASGIIRTIETDDKGDVWIGSSTGLYYLPDGQNTAKLITTPFDLVGMVPSDVFSIELTDNGEIWLALYNLGVLRWNPKGDQAKLLQNHKGEALTDLNITLVYQDSKNNIWIGSNLIGLFKFNQAQNQIKLYDHDYNNVSSISSNRITDVFEDSNQRLWVATGRGLNQYSHQLDAFVRFTYHDSLVNSTVNFILEDSQQNLWLGFKFGLSRFNPNDNEINDYLLNAAIKHDGLIARAAVINDEDVIYLGSANGFYTFDPNNHKSIDERIAPLVLNGVKIDNMPLQEFNLEYQQNKFKLDHKEQMISFDFSVLDFKAPEQIQYHYRLSGLHDDWLNVSNTRNVVLKEFNPGEYQLAIKATNNDGRWKEQILNIDVVVMPVWWDQYWARALMALSIILLAIFFHYYRTFKIRKQNLLLESEVNKRTTELQCLNEQLEMAASSDYLTGLPNRMSFVSEYEHRQRVSGKSLDSCIVLADVDLFKKVNDKYGHSAGDQILIKLSNIMKNSIENDDVIARWGGEEFILYFHDKGVDTVIVLIEEIRKIIESNDFSYKNQSIPITMTFGVCPKALGMSLSDCINVADKLMYQGKSMGRNRVVVSQPQ